MIIPSTWEGLSLNTENGKITEEETASFSTTVEIIVALDNLGTDLRVRGMPDMNLTVLGPRSIHLLLAKKLSCFEE